MKYLHKYSQSESVLRHYNESISIDKSIIKKIEDYKSEFIKDINQIGSDDNVLQFNLIDYQNKSHILSIMADWRKDFYFFYLDKGVIYDPCGARGSVELINWKEIFLRIEDRFKKFAESDKKLKVINQMFSVITEDLLKDYFANVIDNINDCTIEKTKTVNLPIFWQIKIANHDVKTYGDKNDVSIDDKFIDKIDELISTTKRLKEIFDVTVTYRFSKKNNSLIVCVFANYDGEPIGQDI